MIPPPPPICGKLSRFVKRGRSDDSSNRKLTFYHGATSGSDRNNSTRRRKKSHFAMHYGSLLPVEITTYVMEVFLFFSGCTKAVDLIGITSLDVTL